jgi:hypothetical protein
MPFDHLVLLSNYPAQETKTFLTWLTSIKPVPVSVKPVTLTSPTNFSEIYQAAVTALTSISAEHGQDVALTFHLSPGTPVHPCPCRQATADKYREKGFLY